VLLDDFNKHGSVFVELILGLGPEGLQLTGGSDDYYKKKAVPWHG
jgi:hypothetical protein